MRMREMPEVQILTWKHDFRKDAFDQERYEILEVSGAEGNFHAVLHGTEHIPIANDCKNILEGCLLLEQTFQELFPDHNCGPSCFHNWQAFDKMHHSDGRLQ
jgi:hypothetical protein